MITCLRISKKDQVIEEQKAQIEKQNMQIENMIQALTEVSELDALGATMCTGIGVGRFKGCRDAVAKCVRVIKVYKPDPDKVLKYEDAFKAWEHCYYISIEEIYK